MLKKRRRDNDSDDDSDDEEEKHHRKSKGHKRNLYGRKDDLKFISTGAKNRELKRASHHHKGKSHKSNASMSEHEESKSIKSFDGEKEGSSSGKVGNGLF